MICMSEDLLNFGIQDINFLLDVSVDKLNKMTAKNILFSMYKEFKNWRLYE